MPVFIEEVITVRLRVSLACLEIGSGKVVVVNAIAAYIRRTSGYGACEGTSVGHALPDWTSLPIISPYDFFPRLYALKGWSTYRYGRGCIRSQVSRAGGGGS